MKTEKPRQAAAHGYFRTQPQMALRFKPIAHLLTEQEVHDYKKNWDQLCNDTNQICVDLKFEYRGETSPGINRHEALAAILNLTEPLEPIRTMLRQLRYDRPASHVAGFAVHVRSEMILHICAQKAFRVGTLQKMQCQGPESHIKRDNETYRLVIPGALFKNRKAARFKTRPYDEELRDYEGCHEVMHTWLNEGRAKLLGSLSETNPYLFVTRRNNSRVSSMYISNEVRRITRQYLGENANSDHGIKGIFGFGPHGFRHIVATSVLRQTRSLLLAAEAIADDPKTIYDHYASYLPSDIQLDLEKQRDELWKRVSKNRLT